MAFYLVIFWPITICSLILKNGSKKKEKGEGKEITTLFFLHSVKSLQFNLQILGYLKEDSLVKYFRCSFTEESLVFGFMMR